MSYLSILLFVKIICVLYTFAENPWREKPYQINNRVHLKFC
jgi:hypothetical protein